MRTSSRPRLRQRDAGEIGDHVGRQVRGRIADLVEQLLGDRLEVDRAAAAGRLGEDERAVLLDLGDGIADSGQIGLLPVAPQPAGGLGAALDEMPGHRRPRPGGPSRPTPSRTRAPPGRPSARHRRRGR